MVIFEVEVASCGAQPQVGPSREPFFAVGCHDLPNIMLRALRAYHCLV